MVWVLVVVQALALVPVLAVVPALAQAREMEWVLAVAEARWGWVLVLPVPTHPTVQTWLDHLPGSTTLLGRCFLDRLLCH